jgi:hypothetical protein
VSRLITDVMLTSAYSLCVFCIRKRRRDIPVRRNRPIKPPALERSEARERLQSVAEVSSVIGDQKTAYVARYEEKVGSDSESMSEREWCVFSALGAYKDEADKRQRDLPLDIVSTVTT